MSTPWHWRQQLAAAATQLRSASGRSPQRVLAVLVSMALGTSSAKASSEELMKRGRWDAIWVLTRSPMGPLKRMATETASGVGGGGAEATLARAAPVRTLTQEAEATVRLASVIDVVLPAPGAPQWISPWVVWGVAVVTM